MSELDWTDHGPGPDEAPPGPDPALAFPSLPAFVEDFFLEVCFRGQDPSAAWCPRWWDHEDVVLRLEALWDAFEALRTEAGVGTAVWIRDYLDPTIAAVTNRGAGPFRQCDPRRDVHQPLPKLACVPPPEGMFVEGTGS